MDSTDAAKAKNQLLIAALARGATQAQAARESGLSERTVRRRLKSRRFRARIVAEQRKMIERARSVTVAAGVPTVKKLLELMGSGQKPSVQLGATRALLGLLPLRQGLDDLAAAPEAQRIEIVFPDWRKELRERLERGEVLSARGLEEKKTGDGAVVQRFRGGPGRSVRGILVEG